ncbi:hypothetical protein ACBJ59_12050 [Nonomuraea sp. MTCD27]|uniref:hypothetical protein n=1 Tax=Nonomuraea sp. MTCD27 TaxID=1676747 RepID=UPI0035C13EEA
MADPTGTPVPPQPRKPAHEIPEFRDVEQLGDGSWRAVHTPTGEVIAADTFEWLERVEAPALRIAYSWKRTS